MSATYVRALVVTALVCSSASIPSSAQLFGPAQQPFSEVANYFVSPVCTPLSYDWTLSGGGTISGGGDGASFAEVTWTTIGSFTVSVDVTCSGPAEHYDLVTGVNGCELDPASLVASESSATLEVALTRVGGTSGQLDCELSDLLTGTAEPGADYTSPTATVVSWADGVTTSSPASVSIPLIDDGTIEGDETIQLQVLIDPVVPQTKTPPSRVSAPAVAPIQVDTAAAKIVDDESASLAFSAATAEMTEGETLVLEVERSGDPGAIGVDATVVGGTATEGVDFDVTTFGGSCARNVCLGSSDASASLELSAITDAAPEGDETIVLELFDPEPGENVSIVAPRTLTVTVRDAITSPGSVRFSANLFAGFEGQGTTSVTVERFGGADGSATVSLCVDGGSTASAADYSLASNTLRWAGGESGTRVLTFDIVDDQEIEATELVELSLCDAGGAEVGEPSRSTVAIGDNEVAPGLDIPIADDATDPENPVVAYGIPGQKVVVWQAPDGDGFGIFAMTFISFRGSLPFRVNPEIAGNQTDPTVTFDDSGTFFIAYREEQGLSLRAPDGRLVVAAQSTGIVGRSFSSPSSPSAPVPITNGGDADSVHPTASSDKDGETTVTWEDGGKTRGKVVGPGGKTKTGTFEIGVGCDAEVATAASGDFVVVWLEGACDDGAGQARANGAVRMRRYDDDGRPQGPAMNVAQGPRLGAPAVAVDDAGRTAVAWHGEGEGGGLDIYARLYDESGKPAGQAFVVNELRLGDQSDPRVDANSVFDLAFVWADDAQLTARTPPTGAAAAGSGITGRFFSAQGKPTSHDVVVATADTESEAVEPDVSIEDDDETTVVWQKRKRNDGSSSGLESKLLDPRIIDGTCAEADDTLCLNQSRFEVSVEWQDFEGNNESGHAEPLTGDSGTYWFFNQDNVEIILKVLDGCSINGRFWVFAAGLTNVEVNLRVDDVLGGESVSYFNSLGSSFQPILDTDAFASCDVRLDGSSSTSASLEQFAAELGDALRRFDLDRSKPAASPAATCAADATHLCLNGDRFEVAVAWRSATGSGSGQAAPLTADSGTFWFFEPDNVEVIVKVLQACSVNGHIWVFAAGLTDTNTTMTVTDSTSSRSTTYENPLGTPFAPILDIEAFACP